MRLHFESDEDLRRYIAEQVLTTSDLKDTLDVSRQRIYAMLEQGKFVPFKEQKSIRLFFKDDVEKALEDIESNRKKYGLGPIKKEAPAK